MLQPPASLAPTRTAIGKPMRRHNFAAMTLVLTAINAACVVQASDRLTTKWRGQRFLGEHDPIANKTVICLTYDGPMVVSFAGTAYVGDELTDNWIARQLAGRVPNRMPDGRTAAVSFQRLPTRTLNGACWLLQQAIEAEPAFNASQGLEVAIGGWRVRRRRLVQTLLAIVKTKNGALRHGHMKLRTADFGSALCSIGVDPVLADLKAARSAHPDQRALLTDAATRSAFLAEMIVRTSRSNQAVGSDVISVEIPRWQPDGLRRVTIRFMPEVERYATLVGTAAAVRFPAAFWPWIVTPMGMRAPTVSTGGDGLVFHSCGWEFVHKAPVATLPRGLLHAESSIQRPKPPR